MKILDTTKTLATMTAAAALVVGMSVANAQTSHKAVGTPAPHNINAGAPKGTGDTMSGSETKGATLQGKSGKNIAQDNAEKSAKGAPPPNNINAGATTGYGDKMSGSEASSTANNGTGTSMTGSTNLKRPTPNAAGNAAVPSTKK
jgi:hypothetical protein